jgi:hypothetical protein
MGLLHPDRVIRVSSGMYCGMSTSSQLVFLINGLAALTLANGNFSRKVSAAFVALTMVVTVFIEGKV